MWIWLHFSLLGFFPLGSWSSLFPAGRTLRRSDPVSVKHPTCWSAACTVARQLEPPVCYNLSLAGAERQLVSSFVTQLASNQDHGTHFIKQGCQTRIQWSKMTKPGQSCQPKLIFMGKKIILQSFELFTWTELSLASTWIWIKQSLIVYNK